MAIILCPYCGSRISSRLTKCSSCKSNLVESGIAQEQLERDARKKRFKRTARLQTSSFLLVLLFAAGTLVMYSGLVNNDEVYFLAGKVMVLVGFIGYFSIRIMLFLQKHKA